MSILKKWCMTGCFILLCLLLTSILVRFATYHIAVKKFHINNTIVRAILFDRYDMLQKAERKEAKIEIDWAKLYPFDDKNIHNSKQVVEKNKFNASTARNNIFTKIGKQKEFIEKKVSSIERRVSDWTNKHLVLQMDIVDLYAKYNMAINWLMMSRKEYNSVVEIEDGQLASYCDKEDMSDKINNVVELATFCKENGSEFLYVSAPSKFDRHEKQYATLDFSNSNADSFLSGLKENGVRYVDIRDSIDREGLITRNLFYRTDHHWLAETGLWATKIVANYLNDENIIKSDIALLASENWDKEIYKNFFLGSRGKKITLNRAKPDDITIYHPKFSTDLHMEIPSEAINTDGSFDIIYDIKPLEKLDYYHLNPYGAYSWGDQPYIYIRNNKSVNNTTVLLIKNSFGNVVFPFLSLQFRNAYELDLRHFTGSVREFIKQKKPDIVILLYHIEDLSDNIEYALHNNKWDFR